MKKVHDKPNVVDLQGSVQSPDFVPQPLILPSERVLPSHRSVKSESNLVGRFYRKGPTLVLLVSIHKSLSRELEWPS